jgi:hypothetical protein
MLSVDSRKLFEPSLRVVKRFCALLLFFACWAAFRHWPYPMHPLANMLKVSFAACVALALIRRERFADKDLNTWDEALAYFAVGLLVDSFAG